VTNVAIMMLTASVGKILGMTEPRRSRKSLSPEGRFRMIMPGAATETRLDLKKIH
jgi:hypothetical protein